MHVRGCWRPNVNFIFWPHCYDRHVVSLLFSWCSTRGLGVHSIGAFPRAPSVGCGLTYHIWSLAVWKSAGNCIGGFPSAPSVGCGLPYHIWSLLSRILLATASGVCKVPLGRVWPSLPHLVSIVWKSTGNCFGTPNSTELNNNSTPTRSPTGSLNRMFNRHQAEITVMQFRGYSLPVHDCNGTMRPSPCPISRALIRPRDLFRLLAVGMCHFLPVYYLGIVFLGRVEGQNITMVFGAGGCHPSLVSIGFYDLGLSLCRRRLR